MQLEQLSISFVEIFFSLGLFINAILFIPQLLKLYRTKDSQGLSLTTFGGFSLIQIFTVLHGYLHQDHLLIWGSVLSLMPCGGIAALIIYYRRLR